MYSIATHTRAIYHGTYAILEYVHALDVRAGAGDKFPIETSNGLVPFINFFRGRRWTLHDLLEPLIPIKTLLLINLCMQCVCSVCVCVCDGWVWMCVRENNVWAWVRRNKYRVLHALVCYRQSYFHILPYILTSFIHSSPPSYLIEQP